LQTFKKKDPAFPIERLRELDERKRTLQNDVEALRHQKNELAQQGKKGVTPELRQESIAVGKELKQNDLELTKVEEEFKALYLACPNSLLDDVPAGGKEQNKVEFEWGSKPSITTVKNHIELGVEAGWFDFETAATMTGNNFVLYKEPAVKLMYALTMFMLKHNKAHGYEMILPPYLVNARSLEIAGSFPKFRDDVYRAAHDDLYLAPTSEVNCANLYRKHIFASQELPKRFTSWTSCFRRETGGYGAADRGLIRLHQFEKVELYTYCRPEHSQAEHQRMLDCAQSLLQKLGIPYRVVLLAAGDTSFQSAKTYDLEVWLPGQDAYVEVSSCSNCTDFQARRGLMRYRQKEGDKTQLVHTLNGSSLALPRLMVAIMENFQQSDGSIVIPEVLQGYGLYD